MPVSPPHSSHIKTIIPDAERIFRVVCQCREIGRSEIIAVSDGEICEKSVDICVNMKLDAVRLRL